MTTRSSLRATGIGIAAVLLLAPAALADTCCANIPVRLDPSSGMPGDIVRLIGMQCLNADNTGPLSLRLGTFWLSPSRRAADDDPASAPAPGLPSDLPPVEKWHSFATVPDPSGTVGDATITVPDLPRGTYQLWWWCDDGSGPGGGIHYSTGPRLAIGGSPNTAIEAAVSTSLGRDRDTPGATIVLIASLIGFRIGSRRFTRPQARPSSVAAAYRR